MNKKVLLLEPNPWHYVCLPGNIKHLTDLGYEVDVVVKEHGEVGDEFQFSKSLKFNRYEFQDDWFSTVRELLNKEKYSFIFLNSYDYGIDGPIDIYSILKDIDNTECGVIGCYHSFVNLKINHHESLLNEGRVCMLSDMELDGKKPYMVCTTHYCDDIPFHRKSEETSFISIGMNNSRFDCERAIDYVLSKNKKIQMTFIGRYDKKALDKSRLKRKIFYPIIKILNIKKYLKDSYKPGGSKKALACITDYGSVKYEVMYQKLMDSDFLILNIRDNTDEFLKERTSGAKLLAYGFCKPPILKRAVADAYGFDDTNAIVYEEGKFGEAMYRASSMSNEDYQQLVSNLKISREKLDTRSRENLQNMISNISK